MLIKSFVVGSSLLTFLSLSVSAQVHIDSGSTIVETNPSGVGGVRIITPNTSVNVEGTRSIFEKTDNGDVDNNKVVKQDYLNRRENSRSNRHHRQEIIGDTITSECSKNDLHIIRIRGSNQRVQQRVESTCQ